MAKSIGLIIREKRSLKGFTQEQLADAVGVTPQAVSKWENDIAYPDITLLKKIAEVLDSSVSELLGEEKETTTLLAPEKIDISKMMLRIRIKDDDDKVKINLPVGIIEVFLSNEKLIDSFSQGKGEILKSIDLKSILQMIHMGVIGKLVEIESKDGAYVEIYVDQL